MLPDALHGNPLTALKLNVTFEVLPPFIFQEADLPVEVITMTGIPPVE